MAKIFVVAREAKQLSGSAFGAKYYFSQDKEVEIQDVKYTNPGEKEAVTVPALKVAEALCHDLNSVSAAGHLELIVREEKPATPVTPLKPVISSKPEDKK